VQKCRNGLFERRQFCSCAPLHRVLISLHKLHKESYLRMARVDGKAEAFL
jgi:hypothetical protein